VAHTNDRNFSPGDQSESDTSITHFSPEFTFTEGAVSANLSSSINTHSLLVGVTFRF
jgi:hypothetical protein